jgi:hypothetical protein
MRTLVALFLSGHFLAAQSISIGVNGGVRATKDVISGVATNESRPYVVGPSFEVMLPRGFGFEFDALYHRVGYRYSHGLAGGGAGYENVRERSNSWELPLLFKYEPRTSEPSNQPFIEAGYSWRTMPGSESSSGFLNAPTGGGFFQRNVDTHWQDSSGLVVGGGIRLGAGRFRNSLRLRYTHWSRGCSGNSPNGVCTGISEHIPDGPTVNSTQNQVDIMLGLEWRVRRTR